MYFLTLALVLLIIFGVSLGAATVLVAVLRGAWRQARDQHWTERARLAFAPGSAVLSLAVLLPFLFAFLGDVALGVLAPGHGFVPAGFVLFGATSMAGVLTVRYRWLRELWGSRVTLRSWISGMVVVLLVSVPQFVVLFLVVAALPEAPGLWTWVIMMAGVLTLAFLVWGGTLRLWRWLGIARPAPEAVTTMVKTLAAEMRVPGEVRVLQLEWPQVNAVAWVLHGSVGFSRAMLAVMDMDELRAIAAHELGHLLEPRRVKVWRVLHLFAYLPLAPLMKYGGLNGVLLSYFLMVAIFLVYKSFARRLEVRADHLEHEAVKDPSLYARSMVKLHESNLVPAVMPGKQTHPHLYDRLLAAGVQPDFPRPSAPDRTRPLLATLATIVVATLVFIALIIVAGCNQQLGKEKMAQPTGTNAASPSQVTP